MVDVDRVLPRTVPNVGTRIAGIFVEVVAAVNIVLQTLEHAWKPSIVVLVIGLVVFGVRLMRAGVRMDIDGFTSRDAFATTRLSWDQVIAFDKHRLQVRAQLRDGTWRSLQPYGIAKASGADLVEQLRQGKAACSNVNDDREVPR